MQFFTIADKFSINQVLIIPLKQRDDSACGIMREMHAIHSCFIYSPSWHSYLVVDFSGGTWKTVIALDEESEDGHRIGDE